MEGLNSITFSMVEYYYHSQGIFLFGGTGQEDIHEQ